jgi:hypothetical protein
MKEIFNAEAQKILQTTRTLNHRLRWKIHIAASLVKAENPDLHLARIIGYKD